MIAKCKLTNVYPPIGLDLNVHVHPAVDLRYYIRHKCEHHPGRLCELQEANES